jgi:phytoene dehydrogenase-like protein
LRRPCRRRPNRVRHPLAGKAKANVTEAADAVVVGAGPNGLVCANLLADAGWDVVVLEANAEPGGAVSSASYLGDGFIADRCSAFYPLVAASPVFRALALEDHGLRLRHAPAVLAHPLRDGRAVVLHRELDETCDALERASPGDGGAWRRLFALWQATKEPVLEALTTPFPPLRAGFRLATTLRADGLLRFGRFATLPVRRLSDEEFQGAQAGLLLAGCSVHSDLTPDAALSGTMGWLLAMLGQDVGFPVAEGGAGALTASMVRRLKSRGGQVQCGRRVAGVIVRLGRAVGVVTEGGEEFRARRAVVADVAATRLYGQLVPRAVLPGRLVRDLDHFQWDNATVKVDWALRARVPWTAPELAGAGTVHLGGDMDDISVYGAELARGLVPAHPFLVVGQMSTADPTRSPAGTEVVWAYTHVPQRVRGDAGPDGITGNWAQGDTDAVVARMEQEMEAYAPGFKHLVAARHAMGPPDLEAYDANLVNGAVNGGTSGIHQQLAFRPVPGLGRPETPIARLYLASASAHPGGGVHGACGANAARAALKADRGSGKLLAAFCRLSTERVGGLILE